MKRLQSFRAILLAAMALIAQILVMPFATATAAEPPNVPANIAVPAGSTLLFSRQARGVQVYECINTVWIDGAPQTKWTLRAPRAVLFDPTSNQAVGFHYGGIDRGRTPGPWWDSIADDSRIRGAKVDEASSPHPDSIPLLLVKVVERENAGAFAPVTHIQRLNTVGGVGPTGACETGARRDVPYTADYFFYAAP